MVNHITSHHITSHHIYIYIHITSHLHLHPHPHRHLHPNPHRHPHWNGHDISLACVGVFYKSSSFNPAVERFSGTPSSQVLSNAAHLPLYAFCQPFVSISDPFNLCIIWWVWKHLFIASMWYISRRWHQYLSTVVVLFHHAWHIAEWAYASLDLHLFVFFFTRRMSSVVSL